MRCLSADEVAHVSKVPSTARKRIFEAFSERYYMIACGNVGLDGHPTGLAKGLAGIILTGSLIASLSNEQQPLATSQVLASKSIDSKGVLSNSFLFGIPGLSYVQAFLEQRMSRPPATGLAMNAFLESSARVAGPDVYLGHSGALLACLSLLEFAANDKSTMQTLRASAREHATAVVKEFDSMEDDATGYAHGQGGALYALLRYTRCYRDKYIVSYLRDKLRSVAATLRVDAAGRPMWQLPPSEPSSLCNGSAGQLLLAVEAAALEEDLFGEALPSLIASASAFNTRCAHLCCGLAGQAFALLAAHRLFDDLMLFDRSLKLAEAAAIILSQEPANVSLFRGSASIAWYTACLTAGMLPAIPILEV